jgi:hypothetical protein
MYAVLLLLAAVEADDHGCDDSECEYPSAASDDM